jgi:geranylgeranyl pyrophosphate synthase
VKNIKQRYFGYSRETAKLVDQYVASFLDNHFTLYPQVIELLRRRYRFEKAQLRPAVVRLAFELVGGRDWQTIIPACAAVEVRETGYYCLDDIIDQEGEHELMLLGTGFHAVSSGMINEIARCTEFDDFLCVLDELFKLDEHVLQGAIIDLNMKNTDENYYMLKVQGYSFWEHILKIGGILGLGSDQEIELLGKIGKNIGMAHTIANDFWDFGKELEDFRQLKATLPILYAFKNTTGKDHSVLEQLYGKKELSAEEIETVRRIIVQSGTINYGNQYVKSLCDEAIRWLQDGFATCNARELLIFSTTYPQKNKYLDLLEKYK